MYKIVWTNEGKSSLFEVINFILDGGNTNTSYVNKILDEILNVEHYLSKSPFIGVQVLDLPTKKLRKIVILEHYSLIYRVYNDSYIDVIYFWDNRQNPKKLDVILGKPPKLG